MDLTPKTAHRIVRGGDEEVDLGQTARPRTMGCRADDEVKGGSASASDAAIACCARFGALRSLFELVHEDL